MFVELGERSVKIWRLMIFAAALICIASPQASAADPRTLQGRWAVDPQDCVDNRSVWVFSNDRAGLFIDNGAVSGWRRASYADTGDSTVSVVLDGAPRREFRWRLRGANELSTLGVLENGRIVEDRSFQVWLRCAG